MADCEHIDFEAHVDVARLQRGDDDTSIVGYSVEVHARCRGCGEPIVFHGRGLPVGWLSDRPCLSADGTELRVPGRLQSDDPAFGLGLTGVTMRIREGEHATDN